MKKKLTKFKVDVTEIVIYKTMTVMAKDSEDAERIFYKSNWPINKGRHIKEIQMDNIRTSIVEH